MKKIMAALICTASLWAQTAADSTPSAGADIWEPLRFLIGTWEAKTKGGSAGAVGSGTYTFQLELKAHVLARRSSGADCRGPADFNCEHSDFLYIYRDAPGKPFRAILFDNEGHVIHYDISVPNPATAVFLSDPAYAGPQYRLSYNLKDGIMAGKFEMRMPGRTEFTPYLEWSGTKK